MRCRTMPNMTLEVLEAARRKPGRPSCASKRAATRSTDHAPDHPALSCPGEPLRRNAPYAWTRLSAASTSWPDHCCNCGIFRNRAAGLMRRRATGALRLVTPGEMRSGALLFKAKRRAATSRRRSSAPMSTSRSAARRRAPASPSIFHNPTDGWVEARLRLPAAGRQRRRHPEDGDRRPRHRRRHQGARGGQGHLRAGQGRGPEGGPPRTGAAEPLHQLGRQYRPRRDRRSSRSSIRSRCGRAARPSRCACRSSSRRATTRRRWCRPSTSRPAAGLGPAQPIRCRTATASRRRSSIRASTAPVNPVAITVRLQAGFPLGEVKSHHHTVKIEHRGGRQPHRSSSTRPVPGRPRFRADLDGQAGRRADRRPLPRARRRGRLPARLRHAAGPRADDGRAAARDRLRHRQFRLDGRHLDARRPRPA